MIFRRRDKDKRSSSPEDDAAVAAAADEERADVDPSTLDESVTGEDYRRVAGPWDASERPVDGSDRRSVDLGSIVVQGRIGFELRLQTDKETEAVQSVMLVAQDGAVELRAFARSRTGGLWDDVRKEIAADAGRRGGTVTELDGRYGTELRLVAPVRTSDGRTASQTSRIVGIEGPRWLLRATYLGRPAAEPDGEHLLEAAVRDLIIVRGDIAMPPREQIPLRLPAAARRVES